MAGLATADFSSAMKTLYLGPLNDTTFRSHVLLNRLEKNTKDVSGNFAYIPLISNRNPAVGSRAEPATGTVGPLLPEAGRQSYTSATFTMGLHYGRGSVSGTTKRKSRNNAGAFAKAIDAEMQGLMRSMPDDLNRQICGYGNGRAASLSAEGAATQQAASEVILCSAVDPFTMRVGDRVHVADITAGPGTDTNPTAGTTVSSIAFYDADGTASTVTHTVTLAASTAASITTAADAFYFGADSGTSIETNTASSSYAQEIYGIGALIDDGNIGIDLAVAGEAAEQLTASVAAVAGITRSSNAFWQSTVKANPASAGTNRPITETILQEAWLTAVALNGAVPNQIEGYCSPEIWGTLGMTQVGSRIYNDYKDTVDMGFTFINLNGSKIFYDRDIHTNNIFFLSMPNIFLLTQNDYEFLDDDGGVLRNVANRDAWEFAINRDVQLGSNGLRQHVKLKDLTSTMRVTGSLH